MKPIQPSRLRGRGVIENQASFVTTGNASGCSGPPIFWGRLAHKRRLGLFARGADSRPPGRSGRVRSLEPLEPFDVEDENGGPPNLHLDRIRHIEFARLHDGRQRIDVLRASNAITPDD